MQVNRSRSSSKGSYGNHTNIYGESDVDTVIRLDSIFRGDVSGLTATEQAAYHQAYGGTATYTFDEFKKGVATRLTTAFGGMQNPETRHSRLQSERIAEER